MVRGGLVGICVPSVSTSNFMYTIRAMLNLYAYKYTSTLTYTPTLLLPPSAVSLYFMAEDNIGQNLSPRFISLSISQK